MSSGTFDGIRARGALRTNAHDTATAFTDAAETRLFDPPARTLTCSGAGNVIVTLAGDDTADGAKKVTIAMTTGWANRVDNLAIRKIWLTNTTATGIQAFY